MFCNGGFALSLSDLFKTNTLPTELFGIKLFENINKYSNKKLVFLNMKELFGTEKLLDPFLEKLRAVGSEDLNIIKNDRFEFYNIYVDEKSKIIGIDASAEEYTESENFQHCINEKKELISKIVELYELDINNFKEQNYFWSNNDHKESDFLLLNKDNLVSQSRFNFKHDGSKLSYAISCEFIINNKSSILWIEIGISKLIDVMWNQNYAKTNKSLKQFLNLDLKGI
jgi:hypothetical protein